MRALVLMFFILSGLAAQAQEPRVTVEMSQQQTLVGQPVDLVVKILVPTWMLDSPGYPTFEVPSLMVRLPQKSTIPISERIDGETWSGVHRTYRLLPLEAGEYAIPPQVFDLTYADPETRDAIRVAVPSPEVRFEAIVPAAARGLTPLILAEAFTLEQEFEGVGNLSPGDAVVRTVRAFIKGTTAILIPDLIPPVETSALRAYPAEPGITEQFGDAGISGTRTEKVTYLAQANGKAALPAITVRWYDTLSGEVKTETLPGFEVTVAGEVAAPAEPLSGEQILRIALAVLAVGLAAVLLRRFWPRITRQAATLRDRWQASEAHARKTVSASIRARDLGKTYSALGTWKERSCATDAMLRPLDEAFAEVGRSIHGNGQGSSAEVAWRNAKSAFDRVHRTGRRANSRGTENPTPLNPF